MRKWLGNRLGIAVIAVSLMVSTTGFAHGGGGWHGGGGGWHGGGWHGGYYHGGYGGWHGGYYGGWGGGWYGPGVVIGVPYYNDDYYYNDYCQTVRVCNNYGHCWLQQSCY